MPRLAWALLLVLLVAARLAADGVDLAALVHDLDAEDASQRTLALTTLQRLKDRRAVALLVEQAPGFSLLGRTYAASVLEAYDEKDVRDAFRRLARGADPFLACVAGRALLRWGEPGAVQVVVSALTAPVADPLVRLYMVNRLYGVREAPIRAALRAWIVPGADASLLGSVLQVLQEEVEPETLAAVRALVASADPDGKALAGAFLLACGDETGGQALAEALRSGAAGSVSLFRVRTMLARSGTVPPAVLEALTEALGQATEPSVLQALLGLVAGLDHRGALGAVGHLLDHENALVAKAALETVTALGGELEAERLQALLVSPDAMRRLAAADLLRRMDDARGLPEAIRVLQGGTVAERLEAARVVGGFARRDAADALLDALLDEDVSVRQQALWAVDGVLRNLFPYRRLDLVAAGYLPAEGETERRAALLRIRAWWTAHR